ncbi:DNRLRE domain-containing protein [Streptomyces cinereoruber]|uniref:DNRLRE domain-containing protein n=1 Tax=Streptomyces cinereoruber TaxID=67260 RepID=UPI003C2C2392
MLDSASYASAQPPQAAAAKPKQEAVTQAADIASARVAAKLSGKRVEALSERTETSTTWANKDGSLTTELAAGPVRFQDSATGAWRAVDVDLIAQTDGSVAAKAHPEGLILAGKTGVPARSLRAAQTAATTDLVTLGQGDEQITLQWRGGLPAPQLDGTRATYVNAVPGADVVVEATRTGFEQFVELKQKPATDSFSYTLPLKTKGLKVEQQSDGSVLFTDKKSKRTATMPAPVMWDATVDTVSGEHTHRSTVAMNVVKTKGGVDLVITPDAAFLADPATRYPVTVDPSTSALGNLFDTYVQQGETVDWSNDVELDLGNPGTKNTDGTYRIAQSYITWNTAPVSDAMVSSATLSLWNFHSGNTDCSAQPWEVWTANNATTASRWTNRPAMVTKMATSTQTKGNPGCSAQPDGWINADVTNLVQHWANNKWSHAGMGLKATDENDTKEWKRVNSANASSNVPKLSVTYNYRPRTGTKQEAGPPYFSYSGAYVVNTVTPTLRDTFVDVNGDKVNGTFQIFDNATNTQVGDVIVSPWVNSGQVASVTVPSGVLTGGKTYKFRTSPYDGAHYNLGWSAWKTFTVDTAAPSAPTGITSTDYPTTAWVKGAGQAGTFTVTPPAADHNWLEWSLDDNNWTKVATGGASGAKTISVTPPKDGTHTLQIRSVDKADNKSEPVEYTFHAGPGGFLQPSDGEYTARRLPLIAEADAGKYNAVSFSWRRSEADTWTQIPAGQVTSGGTPLTAWPLAMTGGKNAPLVWNAAETVNPDGTVEIKADFSGPGGTGSTQPLDVIVDRNATDAATDPVGPGALNLLTGDYTLSASDVSAFGLSVSRAASSRNPDKAANAEGQAPIFGEEWVSGTVAEATESDYSHIRRISTTAVVVVESGGEETHFTANAAKSGWIPETGSESLTLTGSVTGSFTLSDTEGTVTTFTKPDASSATWQVSSSLMDGLTNSTTTVVSETVTVSDRQLARPKRVIAPTSAASAAACTATPSTKGCRSLELVYSTSTTATPNALGDFTGQVKQILLWSTEPGAVSATAKAVQTYAYDADGRLRQAWNPQISPALKTEYTYDTAGRVNGLTPAGELPWAFTYGTAGNAATSGDGMLLKVSRSGLQQGTKDVTSGTASTSVVYDVPLTGAAAPYALGAADVKAWGQLDTPTDATAIFPADAAPPSHDGRTLTAAAYERATITYMGVSGREVNTAAPGGHIATTEYDRFGNTVRELSAGNRAVALGISAADRAVQEELGIGSLPAAERANLLATTSTFNENGTRELEQLGPLRRVDLTADLKSQTTTLVAAGTSVTARGWIINEYDTGRPTDGTAMVRDKLTRSTTGAQVREHPAVHGDTRTSQISYDWVKGLSTQTLHDPGGLAITTKTEYDAQGRITKQLQPGATGTDAATRVITYWTATGTGPCQGRPEWADLVCSTGPAGAVTGGGTNPSQMPTTTTEYNWWGRSATVRDTASGSTRATTIQYDAAGRPIKTVIAGLGQAVPESTTEYDPATGRPVKRISPTGGTISKTFDKLGRLISYSDADGGVTTTQYDLLDRPVKTSDNSPSTVTYTYDHAVEPRAFATKATDSVAGVFQATYDADGSVSSQKLPGGYTLKQTEDTTGAAVRRTYTRDSDGLSIMTDTATRSALGQVTTHAGWSHQSYAYDKAGRLVTVEDTTDTVCTRRTYAFDNHSNRQSLTTAAGTPGLDCPATGGTARSHTYDSADRLVDTGFTYDAFGRATALPGNGTMAYYANDLAYQQTTRGERQTWQLDANLRQRSWKTESGSGSTWTQTASKINHYDSDGESVRWIIEDTTTGALTRNVNGLDGGLAATTTKTGGTVLQLTNIRGDVSLLLPLDSGVAPTVLDADEYGNSKNVQTETRYGWLGSKGVSTEALGGLLVTGVRVYDPSSGHFLSPDPVQGGNANTYGYPADPINYTDADGRYAIPLAPAAIIAAGTAAVAAYIILLATSWICSHLSCTISMPGPDVPLPNPKSKSAKKYKSSKYIGYMIYYKNKIWKYGISRVGTSRPAGQISSCNRYYRAASGCKYVVLRGNMKGWLNARSWEAAMILKYVARHRHCPPGQAKSCR